METICSGCLAGNRKLSQIQETQAQQIYLKIIDELQGPSEENLSAALCWECKSIINRFIKFKKKVKISHQTLQNSIKTKTSINQSLSQSTLTLQAVYQINVAPNTGTKEKETIQDFKIETYWPSTNYDINVEIIKSEEDHDISNSDSETLAVIKKEKNKKQINIKKRTDNEGSEDEHSNVENETLAEIKEEKIKKKVKIAKRKNGVRKKKVIETLCYKELILTEEEIEGERRSMSAQEEYINSIYKCEKCILSFPNADDMKDHIELKHDKTAKFKCPICECTFSNEVSFNYHTNRHVKRYECNKCKDRYATVRKAERHYESHEYFPSYKCDECQDHFGTKEEFEIHNITIHKVEAPAKIVEISEYKDENDSQSEAYPCTVCSKTFKWKTSLRKHMEMHNIEAGVKRRPYCETCRLSFTTTSSLQKHMKTSSKHQVLLKLSKLPDQSASEAANIKPKKGAHCCPLCGHCYQFRGNLRRHMESHRMRANGSLVCAPCNRTFSSQATYQQHIKFSRSHVSEEDFQFVCTECGGRFVSKTRLRDHMDWEHLKRFTHVCDLCRKVFKSHTSLYLHRRVVHANAAHLCDHCGKGFATLTKLRAHVSALHLGKAAHTCSTCLARFSWSSCLARHIKTMHKNT